MNDKEFKFQLRVMDVDSDKYDAEVVIHADKLKDAIRVLWTSIEEDIDVEEAISIVITNIPELRRV